MKCFDTLLFSFFFALHSSILESFSCLSLAIMNGILTDCPSPLTALKNVLDLPDDIMNGYQAFSSTRKHGVIADFKTLLVVMATLHFQYGVCMTKIVATQSKANILAVFKAVRTKVRK